MTSLLKIERSPRRGLMTLEWVMLAYMALTTLLMFFMYTKLQNPESMLWGRVRILFITIAMWGVYRLVPCRLTTFARIVVQMALLSWWYPDTYEFNRLFLTSTIYLQRGSKVCLIASRRCIFTASSRGKCSVN